MRAAEPEGRYGPKTPEDNPKKTTMKIEKAAKLALAACMAGLAGCSTLSPQREMSLSVESDQPDFAVVLKVNGASSLARSSMFLGRTPIDDVITYSGGAESFVVMAYRPGFAPFIERFEPSESASFEIEADPVAEPFVGRGQFFEMIFRMTLEEAMAIFGRPQKTQSAHRGIYAYWDRLTLDPATLLHDRTAQVHFRAGRAVEVNFY